MKAGEVEYYQDAAGKWRWRAIAGNGRVVADSAQGYSRLAGAQRGFDVARGVMFCGERWIVE